MIKKALIFFCLFFLAACVLYGCSSLQKNSQNVDVSVGGTANANQSISYSLVITNPSSESGYKLTITPASVPATITSRLLYSTDGRDFVVPQITFNRAQVAYTVSMDTGHALTGWTPPALDTGINFVIPRSTPSANNGGAVSSTATINLNDIATFNLGQQIFNMIGSVITTINADGTYNFTLALSSQVVLKADIILSGTDEYGNAVTCSFSTAIDCQVVN